MARVREEKRNDRLVGAVESNKELAELCHLQRKNLNILGPDEKERVASVPQREQLASMLQLHLPKRKGTEPLSRSPDCEVGESQGEQELHPGERERGIRVGTWKGEGGLHNEGRQVPMRGGRASKGSLLRRSRRKHEWASGRKSSSEGSAESLIHSKSGKT